MRPLPALALLVSLLSGENASGATATWTGQVNGQWSVAGNWEGNRPPARGDDLLFPASAATTAMVNDFSAGMDFRSITLPPTRMFTISGSPFVLGAGGITGGFMEISAPLTLPVGQTWTGFLDIARIELAGGPATLRLGEVGEIGMSVDTVSGTGGILCQGPFVPPRLSIQQHAAHTGPTVMGYRSFLFLPPGDVLSPVTLNTGSQLDASLADDPPPVLLAPFTLNRGASFWATFTSGSHFALGPQLVARATVTLAGGLGFHVHEVQPGTVLTIIRNASGQPIRGTFMDLPEGAVTASAESSQSFRISYVGGSSGRDVTLTALAVPRLTLFASPTEFAAGTPVTMTAVAPAGTSGAVVFMSGRNMLGYVTLDAAGTATLVTTALGYDDVALGARVGGIEYDPFTRKPVFSSNVVPIHVTGPGATLLLHMTMNDRDAAFLMVDVTWSPIRARPAGNIRFYDGDAVIGTVPLRRSDSDETPYISIAELLVEGLTDGRHVFSAEWIPDDPQLLPRRSGPQETFVASVTPPPVLSVDPPLPREGQLATFTARLPAGVTGGVSFSVANVEIPIDADGIAELTVSTLPAGEYEVSAYYSGDRTHGPSDSSLQVTVVAAPAHAGSDIPALDARAMTALCALLALAAAVKLRH